MSLFLVMHNACLQIKEYSTTERKFEGMAMEMHQGNNQLLFIRLRKWLYPISSLASPT